MQLDVVKSLFSLYISHSNYEQFQAGVNGVVIL